MSFSLRYGNFSFLSSNSTASLGSSSSSSSLASLSASFNGSEPSSPDDSLVAAQGWMYWKREAGCWLKVFAVLRNELLWLARSDSRAARRAPLLQIAVARVERSDLGGVRALGPSGEEMELFPYDKVATELWVDALREAAQLTLSFERAVAVQPLPRRQWKAVEKAYTGTLVVYNEEKQVSGLRQLLTLRKLRCKWRQRLEKIVDRLDK